MYDNRMASDRGRQAGHARQLFQAGETAGRDGVRTADGGSSRSLNRGSNRSADSRSDSGSNGGSDGAGPLFASAEAALRFALNFRADHYVRPVMNRHAAPACGVGKGLAGLDGAAQAGMIRRALSALGSHAEAVLVARMAVPRQRCECGAACCAGTRPNPVWRTAVGVLADYVRTTALAGTSARGPMRLIAVGQYFAEAAERLSLEGIAGACNVSRQTAGSHVARVAAVLTALESDAWSAVEACLIRQGVVAPV